MKKAKSPKVMEPLDNRPMVELVTHLAFRLHPERVLIVVGHQKDMVIDHIRKLFPSAEFVEQREQLGTGHAVLQTQESLEGFDGIVLVLSADVPLLRGRTLERLLNLHLEKRAVATVLTAEFDNPQGYGRIVRNPDGMLKKIVEEKDADPETRKIREINSGVYVFKKRALFEALSHITPENAQHEYYLPDVFEYFWRNHWNVAGYITDRPDETVGVNSMQELDRARKLYEIRS